MEDYAALAEAEETITLAVKAKPGPKLSGTTISGPGLCWGISRKVDILTNRGRDEGMSDEVAASNATFIAWLTHPDTTHDITDDETKQPVVMTEQVIDRRLSGSFLGELADFLMMKFDPEKYAAIQKIMAEIQDAEGNDLLPQTLNASPSESSGSKSRPKTRAKRGSGATRKARKASTS